MAYWHSHLCDAFYADLNGDWVDSNDNGVYDTHKGDTGAEIWVSRIKPNNPGLGRPAHELVADYFSRNHAYRTGKLKRPPRRAFVVWTTTNVLESTRWAARPALLYGANVDVLGGYGVVRVADKLRSFLSDARGYELGIINCVTFASVHHVDPHPLAKQPEYVRIAKISEKVSKPKWNDQQASAWGYTDHGDEDLNSAWVANAKPKTLFYHMLTSEPGRHDFPDYMCGSYMFGGSALVIIAGAQHSGALGTPNIYPDLAAGRTFGEVWRDALNYGATHAGDNHIQYLV